MAEDAQIHNSIKCDTLEQEEVQEDVGAGLVPNHQLIKSGEEIKLPLLSKNESPPVASPVNDGLSNQRLSSLDVYRGLTVAAMILVDYGGGLWWGINHAPWNGVTFADFVVPAFVFIVGVSVALAYKTVINRLDAVYKLVIRVLKLFVLGLLLQGGYLHAVNDLSYGVDIQKMRIMGVLQRITIAYGIVACFELFAKRRILEADKTFCGIIRAYCWHWVGGAFLACLYVGLLYGLYVPTWQFEAPEGTGSMVANALTENISLLQVDCNVRGSLSPGCNAASLIDRSIMGISHLYKRPSYRRTEACSVDSPYSGPLPVNAPAWCMAPFDPEGLLSSLPAVITCFIGAHYGHILLHIKGHRRRIWQWSTTGAVLVVSGLGLDFAGIPLNKQLYTLSYTLLTAGACGLAFMVNYVIVDVYGWKLSTIAFKWIGAHALMIYALVSCSVIPLAIQGLYWKSPENNLIATILGTLGLS
ncbi:hypothetical protein GOP47_0010439 [Adiantum capillus-veneris]|uniref:Heparan-alpha-glucosaminide N-acetyltransferase catalytic domain-containing protein n=1 Tax=Adiantum capillus-veneris TaxID=13818 RepID=A0A9D4UVV4_ADICA|nr:hypothetical protein GOP47_0010439 [Adiantum capillus-veneris]